MDSDSTKNVLFNRLFKFKLKKRYAISKTTGTTRTIGTRQDRNVQTN